MRGPFAIHVESACAKNADVKNKVNRSSLDELLKLHCRLLRPVQSGVISIYLCGTPLYGLVEEQCRDSFFFVESGSRTLSSIDIQV